MKRTGSNGVTMRWVSPVVDLTAMTVKFGSLVNAGLCRAESLRIDTRPPSAETLAVSRQENCRTKAKDV